MESLLSRFRIEEQSPVALKDFDTSFTGGFTKEKAKVVLSDYKKNLSELQDRFYAARSHSLLILFQAMDAAGKDSVIKHVMSGVNPQGCQVFSFKQPGPEDLLHDFLWRHNKALPERGRIGIHNRSHYENVLICKVHPEIVLKENLPGLQSVVKFDGEFWKRRYKSINDFESHLTANGTVILKFFLHVSKEEQKNRFLKRIEDKQKNWKFSEPDIDERGFWDSYMDAYEDAISNTASPGAPWFIIPADHKWFTRIAVISIIVDTLKKLDIRYPELSPKDTANLSKYKSRLLNEDQPLK